MSVYNNQGSNALIEVVIEQYNASSLQYEFIYEGRMNLDVLQESINENGRVAVKVNVEETSFVQKFLNNQKTELDLFDTTTIDGTSFSPYPDEEQLCEAHSVDIDRSYNAENLNQNQTEYVPFDNNISSNGTSATLYLYIEFDNVIVDDLPETFNYGTIVNETKPENDRKFIVKARDAGNYTFNYILNVSFRIRADADDPAGDNEYSYLVRTRYLAKRANGTSYQGAATTLVPRTGKFNSARLQTVSTNQLINIPNVERGDEIFLSFVEIQVFSEENEPNTINSKAILDFVQINQAVLDIDARTTFEPTDVNGMMLYEALNRAAHKITGVPDAIRSTHFGRTDSQPRSYPSNGPFAALNFLSNGYYLRGFTPDDRGLFIAFRDLFREINVIFRAGLGILNEGGKEVIRIEEWQYFYDISSLIYDAGSTVRNYVRSVASEFLYQNINVGYKTWESRESEVAGIDEFNSNRQYRTPIDSVDNEFELQSDLITAGYVIELKRREGLTPGVDPNKQPNKRYDENNVLINVISNNQSVKWKSRKQEGASGVFNFNDPPNVFNYKLSPATILFTWLPWIFGSMWKISNKIVRFAEGTGNFLFRVTGLNFVPVDQQIDESQDWPENRLEEQPRWIPEYFEFETEFDFDTLQLINTNPYGYISFIDPIENIRRYGFIQEVSWSAESRVAKFKLLRANEELIS
jgi:hypothetical protein